MANYEDDEFVEVPTFSEGDPTPWILKMEALMDFFDVPIMQRVNFAYVYVEGSARDWVRIHLDEVNWWSWEQFTTELCLKFGESKLNNADYCESLASIDESESNEDTASTTKKCDEEIDSFAGGPGASKHGNYIESPSTSVLVNKDVVEWKAHEGHSFPLGGTHTGPSTATDMFMYSDQVQQLFDQMLARDFYQSSRVLIWWVDYRCWLFEWNSRLPDNQAYSFSSNTHKIGSKMIYVDVMISLLLRVYALWAVGSATVVFHETLEDTPICTLLSISSKDSVIQVVCHILDKWDWSQVNFFPDNGNWQEYCLDSEHGPWHRPPEFKNTAPVLVAEVEVSNFFEYKGGYQPIVCCKDIQRKAVVYEIESVAGRFSILTAATEVTIFGKAVKMKSYELRRMCLSSLNVVEQGVASIWVTESQSPVLALVTTSLCMCFATEGSSTLNSLKDVIAFRFYPFEATRYLAMGFHTVLFATTLIKEMKDLGSCLFLPLSLAFSAIIKDQRSTTATPKWVVCKEMYMQSLNIDSHEQADSVMMLQWDALTVVSTLPWSKALLYKEKQGQYKASDLNFRGSKGHLAGSKSSFTKGQTLAQLELQEFFTGIFYEIPIVLWIVENIRSCCYATYTGVSNMLSIQQGAVVNNVELQVSVVLNHVKYFCGDGNHQHSGHTDNIPHATDFGQNICFITVRRTRCLPCLFYAIRWKDLHSLSHLLEEILMFKKHWNHLKTKQSACLRLIKEPTTATNVSGMDKLTTYKNRFQSMIKDANACSSALKISLLWKAIAIYMHPNELYVLHGGKYSGSKRSPCYASNSGSAKVPTKNELIAFVMYLLTSNLKNIGSTRGCQVVSTWAFNSIATANQRVVLYILPTYRWCSDPDTVQIYAGTDSSSKELLYCVSFTSNDSCVRLFYTFAAADDVDVAYLPNYSSQCEVSNPRNRNGQSTYNWWSLITLSSGKQNKWLNSLPVSFLCLKYPWQKVHAHVLNTARSSDNSIPMKLACTAPFSPASYLLSLWSVKLIAAGTLCVLSNLVQWYFSEEPAFVNVGHDTTLLFHGFLSAVWTDLSFLYGIKLVYFPKLVMLVGWLLYAREEVEAHALQKFPKLVSHVPSETAAQEVILLNVFTVIPQSMFYDPVDTKKKTLQAKENALAGYTGSSPIILGSTVEVMPILWLLKGNLYAIWLIAWFKYTTFLTHVILEDKDVKKGRALSCPKSMIQVHQ